MALSGRLTKSNSHGVLTFVWSHVSRNFSAMTSQIQYSIQYKSTSYGYTNANISCNVKVGLSNEENFSGTYTFAANKTISLGEGTATVYYNADGDSSTAVQVSASGLTVSMPSISDTITLNNFYTRATFITVPAAITDETSEIPITYDVPTPYTGETINSLSLDVTIGGYATSVSLNTLTSSYTFDFDSDMQDYARSYLNNTTSGELHYTLTTVTSVGTYTSEATSALTIINANPSISLTVQDTNTATTELTGDPSVLVRYHSNAEVVATTDLKKYATVDYLEIANGSNTLFESGTIYGVDDANFYATLRDSRGLEDSFLHVASFIDYVPLTCNLEVGLPTPDGDADITVSGNCFNDYIGQSENMVSVYYRYAAQGELYSNWYPLSISLYNNTYSCSSIISGLDYTKQYTIQARAIDLLEDVYSLETKVKSLPVFDWGENDFNFNVPVNFSEGFTVPNSALKALWNGQYQFNGTSTTVELTTPISELPNGIVLVFAYTDGDTVYDSQIQTFFISKKAVQVAPGALHTFILANAANFQHVGAKSLYIYDDYIAGFGANGNSGTASSSIYFNNAKFVLRWVLGV